MAKIILKNIWGQSYRNRRFHISAGSRNYGVLATRWFARWGQKNSTIRDWGNELCFAPFLFSPLCHLNLRKIKKQYIICFSLSLLPFNYLRIRLIIGLLDLFSIYLIWKITLVFCFTNVNLVNIYFVKKFVLLLIWTTWSAFTRAWKSLQESIFSSHRRPLQLEYQVV